ncbi:MAG: hypothetical protein RL094_296 [Candidatus Parcubacteria bacterium]|jgi:cellulose synthase/poly-beta-1,6-N-acetylglucosamine synthase-like glycosyltransferase
MDSAYTLFSHSLLFVTIYVQIFLLVTLFENRRTIKNKGSLTLDRHPTVTILVPVFNEERTVENTIRSLLGLNYPAEHLKIMVVDDGSKDNTWNLVQKYKDHPQILLHKKENGGKYTALNYGIEQSDSEFIGCLDADSFVDPEALNHILPYFDTPETMAVTPTMKILNPDNMLRLMQNAEYNMGTFIRKIFGALDAQYVTPGPFSIFRRDIFSKIGNYKHAHNTEDLEMALRLQDHHYKIANAHKAIVYTVGPPTLYKLYKQRVRWTGGFIQNAIDYKKMFFNPKYGHLGMFVLPAAMYTMLGTIVFLAYALYKTIVSAITAISKAQVVGWHWDFTGFTFDWWYYNVQFTSLIGVVMTLLIVFSIWYGKHLAGVKDSKFLDILLFLLLYSFISPIWLITSVYNTIRKRDAAWR